MKDLNLPIIKNYSAPADRVLSMEEYLKFVQFNFDHVVDREFYAQWKKVIAVDVPFRLK